MLDHDLHECASDRPSPCSDSLQALLVGTQSKGKADSKAAPELARGRTMVEKLALAHLYDDELALVPWSISECADVLSWLKHVWLASEEAPPRWCGPAGDWTSGSFWLLDNMEGSLRALRSAAQRLLCDGGES